MTKEELLRAMEPFMDETFICVRVKLADGGFFEFPILAVDYMKMGAERDEAYLTLRTFE